MDGTRQGFDPVTRAIGNPPGVASLVCAAAASVVGAVLSLAQIPLLRSSTSVQLLGAFSTGREVLVTVIGVAALVLGIVGVQGTRPRKPIAAAGLALGASIVFGGVVSALYSVVLALLSTS